MNVLEFRRTNSAALSVEDLLEARAGQHAAETADGIVGAGGGLREVLTQAEMVARTPSTVLSQGGTGTGKEVIARFLHNASGRTGNFVQVNCAAIPTELLESELFGHERGAFTGALNSRIGRFELANRGTIFLDEIGDLPLALQPKLLRVLQQREIQRLGSSQTTQIDVRVIAATHQNLAEMVSEQKFREDLYYRLCVFPIDLPPLRQRPQDIPALASRFTKQCAERLGKRVTIIPQQAMDAMVDYEWPGNVRELENFIERSVILSTGDALYFRPQEIERLREVKGSARTLKDAEREAIVRTLGQSNWVVAGRFGAAKALGVPRSTLISKMKRLGISIPPAQAACTVAAGGD